MTNTGKWIEVCREAASEKDPRRMIALAQQAVELWDRERASVKKQSMHTGKTKSGPPAKKLHGE